MESNFCGRVNSGIEESLSGPDCQAFCSCGWTGPTRYDIDEAKQDLQDHYATPPRELK